MAGKTTDASNILIFIVCVNFVHALIDLEELQSINYGIDILSEPTVRAETLPDSAILVTSRYGQQYQCTYPSHTEQQQQKEEEEKMAMETGIIELLKPMEKQACLLKTKDWWTYELCYGKYIRQYHAEEGKIRGNIIYLGHHESDFDWGNETLREARVRSKIVSGRYHSQYYSNGSKCDLTGSGRKAEVRYLCEDGSEDYLARVDEPETCVYVLSVYTSRICKHPHLKSPTPSQPIPISCAPLLSQDEYLRYQSHVEAVRKAEEEANARAKAEWEQLERARLAAMALKEDEDIEGDLASSVNTILKKSLEKEIGGAPTQQKSPNTRASSSKSGWTVVTRDLKDLDDLDTLLDPQGILSSMSVKNKDGKAKPPTTRADQGAQARTETDRSDAGMPSHADATEEDAEFVDLDEELDEFDREVKRLREKQAMSHKRLQTIKDRVHSAVASQFKDIIEEAEAEVGEEMNEELALRQLAASLNQLMQKLETTEQEIKEMDDEINNIAAAKDDELVEKIKTGEDLEDEEDTVQAPPTTRHIDSKVTAGRDEDGRWKVRVRTVTETDAAQEAADTQESQQQQLESSVKQGLEKAGLNTDKVKVHVKIIGAKYTGDDDETIHILSEEDSASFQNMIVAILGGNNEAEREQERFAKLENNYHFTFDKSAAAQDGATATSGTNADSLATSADEDKRTTAAEAAHHEDKTAARENDKTTTAAEPAPLVEGL